MPVLMMQVRIMNMGVAQGLMAVPMRMRFHHRAFVIVLMMRVVDVSVFMLE
jgi:hypothetical protein